MAEPARPEVRYTAFLSYSHKDAAAAGRLHRRLEAYRLPKRLAGSETARGIVPDRLWPIFRDREELPAATDLSETVREALAQSGALIVLCSAHSAESLWVAEEIETFRRLHPDRPILAAVLDGDPPDCFPAALRAFGRDGTWHEPLATDLRRGKDGAHLGLLKLVAGITGVSLDALVQRDAARRIRRVMAVTGAALIAMLVMAALAWFALDARREAEHQRAEAEGLVEFMLTDLRDTLRGVGRLDAMQTVNARALRYYDEQGGVGDLTEESLGRRSRVLQSIGDDELTLRHIALALSAYRQAHRTTAEQLARAPSDPQRILEHAKSENGIGRVYEVRRNWLTAQRYFSAFAAAADRLVAVGPSNPDYMMKAASSRVNLGNIALYGTRNYARAEQYYESAARLLDRAARARPNDLHVGLAQANAYGYLADSFFVRSMWRESLDNRLRQLEIMEILHRTDPDNADIRFRLATTRRGLVYSFYRLGERRSARSQLFQAYREARTLTRRDECNAEWRLFQGLLSYDLLDLGLGIPGGVTTRQLRQDQIDRTNAGRSECAPATHGH